MLLLSVHPYFVEEVLTGRKTVELRKRAPKCQPGDWIAVYSTTPEKQLVGLVEIESITIGEPKRLWHIIGAKSGVTHLQYNQYFADARLAVGIAIGNPKRLEKPVSLDVLRKEWPGFHPPQSFIYLSENQAKFVVQLAEGTMSKSTKASSGRKAA